MSRTKIVVGILLLLVVLAGCAPGPNTMADVPKGLGATRSRMRGGQRAACVPFLSFISQRLYRSQARCAPGRV